MRLPPKPLVEVTNPRTGKKFMMHPDLANAPGHWLPDDPKDLTDEDVKAVFGDLEVAAKELVQLALQTKVIDPSKGCGSIPTNFASD